MDHQVKRFRFGPDTIIGLGATVIAIVALVYSIREANESRRHNRLSVKPVLIFETEVAQDDSIERIHLKNLGTGPAIIKSFTILIDDKPLKKLGNDRWGDVIEILNTTEIPFKYYWYDPGDVVGINEKNTLLTVTEEAYEKSPQKQLMADTLRRVGIIIEYVSIYDEVFTVKYNSERSRISISR